MHYNNQSDTLQITNNVTPWDNNMTTNFNPIDIDEFDHSTLEEATAFATAFMKHHAIVLNLVPLEEDLITQSIIFHLTHTNLLTLFKKRYESDDPETLALLMIAVHHRQSHLALIEKNNNERFGRPPINTPEPKILTIQYALQEIYRESL